MGGGRRHERIHLQNLRIAIGARRHHFDERIGIPFLCECDDEDCHEFVIVKLPEHDRTSRERLVIVANGHRLAHATRAEQADGYELYLLSGEQQATG